MAKVYLEPITYRCHTTNPDGTFREVEETFFDGKCKTFIEGYILKPSGETLVRDDGIVLSGVKMISSWKPYSELDAAQREYERAMLAQQEATIAELDALVLNLQYNNLINN